MGSPEIFMSDETRQAVSQPVLQFLYDQNQNNGINIPDVMLSEVDVDGYSDTYFSSRMAEDRDTVDSIVQRLGIEPNTSGAYQLRELFIESYQNQIHASAGNISHSGGTFTSINYPNIDNASAIFQVATNISSENHSDNVISINPDDLRAYILFHEIGHLNINSSVIQGEELGADAYANNLYRSALTQGIVSDPRVPEFFAHMRAMSTVADPYGSVAGNYTLNGSLNPDENQFHADLYENTKAQQRVNAFVEDLYTSATGVNDYEEARELAKLQPELLYIQAKHNLMSGQYEDDPLVQNVAENFVLGAERLAPENYLVNQQGQTYEDYLSTQGTPDTFGYDPSTAVSQDFSIPAQGR